MRQTILRRAALTYLAGIPVSAALFVLPVRHVWPLVLGMVLAALAAASSLLLSRRALAMTSPFYIAFAFINCAAITTTGLLFGPLLILPMFLIGSLSAFVSQPTRHSSWTIVAIHLLPVIGLLALELAGVLPRSFDLVSGQLVITPYAVELTPFSLIAVMVMSFLVQVGSTVDVQTGFRRAQEQVQNEIHAQRWHLRQLLPKHHDTGPAPKQDPP